MQQLLVSTTIGIALISAARAKWFLVMNPLLANFALMASLIFIRLPLQIRLNGQLILRVGNSTILTTTPQNLRPLLVRLPIYNWRPIRIKNHLYRTASHAIAVQLTILLIVILKEHALPYLIKCPLSNSPLQQLILKSLLKHTWSIAQLQMCASVSLSRVLLVKLF